MTHAAKALEALSMLGDSSSLDDIERNRLESVIRQALAAPGWLSIESAPRGEEILMAHFSDTATRHQVAMISALGDVMFDWPYGHQPTHWMPLPSPPKGDSRE